MRIVSLLPSATEIVCALGLGDQLVGITHECDWPPEVIGKPVLTRSAYATGRKTSREIHRLVRDAVHGGSSIYELDEEALADLKPDLILTQELCQVCAVSYDQVNDAARSMTGGSSWMLNRVGANVISSPLRARRGMPVGLGERRPPGAGADTSPPSHHRG